MREYYEDLAEEIDLTFYSLCLKNRKGHGESFFSFSV